MVLTKEPGKWKDRFNVVAITFTANRYLKASMIYEDSDREVMEFDSQGLGGISCVRKGSQDQMPPLTHPVRKVPRPQLHTNATLDHHD